MNYVYSHIHVIMKLNNLFDMIWIAFINANWGLTYIAEINLSAITLHYQYVKGLDVKRWAGLLKWTPDYQ